MDAAPFFSGVADFQIEEFFDYSLTKSSEQISNDLDSLNLETWQARLPLDSPANTISSVPALSRSSSIPSGSEECSTLHTPIDEDPVKQNFTLKFTWPADGQLRTEGGHLQKVPPITPSPPLGSIEMTSPMLSPIDSTNVDPIHHEGSCFKCRLTEAEARKCRLQRRREQNRTSQRKFRARKEAKIREAADQVSNLESYVQFLEQHNTELEIDNADLRQKIAGMETAQRQSQSPVTDHTIDPRNARMNHRPGHGHSSGITSDTASRSAVAHLSLSLFDHDLQSPHS